MALSGIQRAALVFVLLSVVVGSLVALVSRLGPDGVASPLPLSPASPQARHVLVYVSGAVASAGLYWAPEGSRVLDVIQMAGGARGDADLALVNLAARVHDGDHIHVPDKPAPPAYRPHAGLDPERVEVLPTSPAPGHAGTGVAAATPEASQPQAPLNVNTATAGELEALPGLGPALSERIVRYRAMHGPFRGPEDLARVPGLGVGRVRQLAPYVYFEQ